MKHLFRSVTHKYCVLTVVLIGLSSLSLQIAFGQTLLEICPGAGIQTLSTESELEGIILTSFDRDSLWLYDIENGSRYPLPDTPPCSTNCRISPDHNWLLYYNHEDASYTKMQLDGTGRTTIAQNAFDVEWWTNEALLVWTTGGEVYLRYETTDSQREYLPAEGLVSVQPGGRWGIRLQHEGDEFRRILVNLRKLDDEQSLQPPINLGLDTPYFNQASWSPDGKWLAYITEGAFDPDVDTNGAEIFVIQVGSSKPKRMTDLTGRYGATRINGSAIGGLSWSPDNSKVAFWAIELLGPNVESNTGNAVIHVLDIATEQTQSYCGFSTTEHTPVPPRLIWSPDSAHVAFAGNIPGDEKGYLLLALNTQTGVFSELTDGVYPTFGLPNIVAWGNKPS